MQNNNITIERDRLLPLLAVRVVLRLPLIIIIFNITETIRAKVEGHPTGTHDRGLRKMRGRPRGDRHHRKEHNHIRFCSTALLAFQHPGTLPEHTLKGKHPTCAPDTCSMYIYSGVCLG